MRRFRPTSVICPEGVKDLYCSCRRAKQRKEITTLPVPHSLSRSLTTAQLIQRKLLQFPPVSSHRSAEIV